MTDDEPKPRRKYWLNEASFWRDVTTRALAALIVVALGYIFAVVTGYVRNPRFSGQLFLIAIGVLAVPGIILGIVWRDRRAITLFGSGLLFPVAVISYFAITGQLSA